VVAYIGLGSNLEQPLVQVRRAQAALDRIPDSCCSRHSPLYRSPPMGPAGQPDYINGVTRLETRLDPFQLLQQLQQIEHDQGRVRAQRWGPRTLDLDLLLYGDRLIDAPALQVPHPGISQRAFVLYPLADLEPALQIPGQGALSALLAACPADGLERVSA